MPKLSEWTSVMYAGALAAAGVTVASGGAFGALLAAAVAGGASGGLVGGVLASLVGESQARQIEDHELTLLYRL